MGSVIGGTYINNDNLNPLLDGEIEIFDKIINLRFIRRDSKKSVTIRSDYEPVFHKDGSVSFKKCVQKPDIKIEYKQVAEGTAIEVGIYITNFFVDGRDSLDKDSMYTVGGDPVERCIIQMGYRHQFPDWSDPGYNGGISEFYDLINRRTPENMGVQAGYQITVQILTGYQQSYPPDRVMYFKGIVGSVDKGLRWDHNAVNMVRDYNESNFPPNLSAIEANLFQLVTSRFVRPDILHIVEIKQSFSNGEAVTETAHDGFSQEIFVVDEDTNEVSLNVESMRAVDSSKWKRLILMDNGLMSKEDAEAYGIPCVVSDTLRNMQAPGVYGHNTTAEELEEMALPIIPDLMFNETCDTIGGQLNALRQHYPFLRWYILPTGTYYFYHEKDTDKDLWNDTFIKELQKSAIFLPAIYDMTPTGTRTIRCPFVSIISPMSSIVFESRHSIGSDISFFYPPNTNNFLVIQAGIKFATVQEDNTMELMCVDLPKKTITVENGNLVITDQETSLPEGTPEDAKVPPPVNLKWRIRRWEVVRHLAGNANRKSSWNNIVDALMASVEKNNPDHWPDGLPTRKAALEALKGWNPEYFDVNGSYMKRYDREWGISRENVLPDGIVIQTGVDFKVPWLLPSDTITIRVPFQSTYPDDQFLGES